MCTFPPIYAAQLDGILRLSEYMLVPFRIHTPPTPQPRYIVWIFHFATHEIGLNHEYIEAHSHWEIDSSLQYPLHPIHYRIAIFLSSILILSFFLITYVILSFLRTQSKYLDLPFLL